MLAFLSILVLAICGLAAAPVWSVVVGSITLATISYSRNQLLFRRASDLGLQDEIDSTLVASLANAFVACSMAFGCGAALRYLSVGWQ